MSDDLVKRLREGVSDGVEACMIGHEAADRIEQLEAALREIEAKSDRQCAGNPFSIHGDYYRIARAALEGKKDG